MPLVFENAGTRLGFATNWKEKPVPLELSWPDGTRETSLLAPRETILLTQPQG